MNTAKYTSLVFIFHQNVTPPESTEDSAGSSDLEELKQSYTSGNYSHLVHPQVIDRLAVEGNQQLLVSETSHFSLVKSSTSDGPVKVGANVRPTVTDPPSVSVVSCYSSVHVL